MEGPLAQPHRPPQREPATLAWPSFGSAGALVTCLHRSPWGLHPPPCSFSVQLCLEPPDPLLLGMCPFCSLPLQPRSSPFWKEAPGSWAGDRALEKPGGACPRSPAAKTPLWRVVPLAASLGQELCQAMKRMGMGAEQEYACDIFRSLMEQPRHTFRASDMPRALTAERRALVVDWLVQVHDYLGLADDTLHLAVYLMNAYLKMSKVRVATLQLLSITCLFLACKVEESTCPQPSQLCFMTEGTVTPKELFCMERKVLRLLGFELHYANPVALLHLLAEVGHASPEVQHLAMYFMELSLMEADTVGVEPALLSVAALCLARGVLGEEDTAGPWALQEGPPRFHLYSASALSAVYPSMARAATEGPRSTLRATFRKYSRPQKLCTSLCSALTGSAYLRRFLGSPTL